MSAGPREGASQQPEKQAEKTRQQLTPQTLWGRLRERVAHSTAAQMIAKVRGAQGRSETGMTELVDEEIRPVRLTAVEKHQAFRTERAEQISTMELTARIHEKLSQDRQLRVQLLTNPYTPRAREVFEAEFGLPLTPDTVRALILAEPREVYDQAVSRMSSSDRETALYRQLDTSADATVRLGKFVEQTGSTLFDMSDEQLFQELSSIAFGGRNEGRIGREFSQSQRRGFRLSIVNFIQDMKTIQPHGQEFIDDVSQMLQKYGVTKEALSLPSLAQVEVTPLGIVITLPSEDYQKMSGEQAQNDSGRSLGKTLFSDTLPRELRGRVILIDKGSSTLPKKTSELVSTRRHELQHAAYARFFERDERYDSSTDIQKLKTYDEYSAFSHSLRARMLEVAGNEVISYAVGRDGSGGLYEGLSSLGGDSYATRMSEIRRRLMNDSGDLTGEQMQEIYRQFEQQRILYMEQVAKYQWVAHQLFEVAGKSKNGLTMEKAIALLQNTRPDRITRLAAYLKSSPGELEIAYREDRAKTLQELAGKADKLVASGKTQSTTNDEYAWGMDMGLTLLTKAAALYPVEAVPTLIKIVTEAPHPLYVRTAMESLMNIAVTQIASLPESTIEQIQSALTLLRERRQSYDFRDVIVDSNNSSSLLESREPRRSLRPGTTTDSLKPDFVFAGNLHSKMRAIVGETPSYRYTAEQERALIEELTGEELLETTIGYLNANPDSLTAETMLLDKVLPITNDAYGYIANALGLLQRLSSFTNLTLEQRQAVDRILQLAEDPQYLPSHWHQAALEGVMELRRRDVEEIRKRLPPLPENE